MNIVTNIVMNMDWNWNSAFAQQVKIDVICFWSSWKVTEKLFELFFFCMNKLSKGQKNIFKAWKGKGKHS